MGEDASRYVASIAELRRVGQVGAPVLTVARCGGRKCGFSSEILIESDALDQLVQIRFGLGVLALQVGDLVSHHRQTILLRIELSCVPLP